MLVVLAAAAGAMDAIAYFGLGVFTTMMTGNTALLAFGAARGDLAQALPAGLALAAFAAGAAAGAFIVGRERSRRPWSRGVTYALGCEALVLAVFVVVWDVTGSAQRVPVTTLLILVSSLAMGLQAAAVRHLGVPGVATTYISTTLTCLTAELVGWARADDDASASRLQLLAAVVGAYGAGAFLGALSMSHASAGVVWLPLLAVAMVVATAILGERNHALEMSSAGPCRGQNPTKVG